MASKTATKKPVKKTASKISKTLPRWDLSSLYSSYKDQALKRDEKKLAQKISNFVENYRGKIAKLSAQSFAQSIAEYEEISDLSGKLSSYAYLCYATNLENKEILGFFQNLQEKLSLHYADLVFFTIEINQLTEAQIKEKSADKLSANYAPWLRNVRLLRPYQLSEEAEQLFLEKSVSSAQAWVRLFDETSARMRFNFENKQVSSAVIFDKLSNKDGKIRKQAAASISKTLTENLPIFTHITNTLAKDKAIEDRWRKFPDPISSRHIANDVEKEVVDALLSSVQKNYKNLAHRYYALKAKWLKKKTLPYWDRNAPLPFDSDRSISWDRAQNIVLSAYRDFSPHLADLAAEFFNKKWIDAAVYQGKESGAFSHPTVPSAHPFILMNYQGKLRDVMTLAHELGHGVHQLLAREQGALMADTPLTLAETASVFGEQLTFQALLASERDEKLKRSMIAHKVEDMLNTVVRQSAFCLFEKDVHAARAQGEISSEQLAKFWLNRQRESLGPAITIDESYGCYWAYIPHFIHSPFYVYAYAFGDCLVNSLYRVYQEKPKGFEEKYLNMLKAGGTLHHKALLKPFALDASQANFWQKGMDVISGFIDQLE
jgi:oligoendopeptidase F